eukprot:scaffold18319_cov29-Prasinocladus_malaysianus.AAC.2
MDSHPKLAMSFCLSVCAIVYTAVSVVQQSAIFAAATYLNTMHAVKAVRIIAMIPSVIIIQCPNGEEQLCDEFSHKAGDEFLFIRTCKCLYSGPSDLVECDITIATAMCKLCAIPQQMQTF